MSAARQPGEDILTHAIQADLEVSDKGSTSPAKGRARSTQGDKHVKTTRGATPIVIATAVALGVAGLTGCTTPSSSSEPEPTGSVKATTTPAPPTPTTKAPEPGSVAVAGYKPADVAQAARFAEQFALHAMSGCGTGSVQGLQHLMTPALYKAAVKNPKAWTVLTVAPPMVMSQGCVTSQKLSDGEVSRGDPSKGMPSIRVAVTVTEGLMVGTTTSPTTLKPVTVSRRYTVDVLPAGKGWLATNVETSGSTLTEGK